MRGRVIIGRMTIARNADIVILTGAGISKESGLSTFRDADGIWSTVRIEDVATPEAFARDPDRVHDFYNERRAGLQDPKIKPNAAHEALARLEAEWGGDVLLVTQNIDNLHARAGSRNLVHMHGEMLKGRCESCGFVCDWVETMDRQSQCPHCEVDGHMRVHVVWFGEMPFEMDRIYEALNKCGLFISIGTSGNVYPASGFVSQVRMHGTGRTVELNLEPSEGIVLFDEARHGPATRIVPDFVNELIG